jgi:hypothetical protein
MAAHMQRQIDSLNDAQFAPSYPPEITESESATPKLDALINESR